MVFLRNESIQQRVLFPNPGGVEVKGQLDLSLSNTTGSTYITPSAVAIRAGEYRKYIAVLIVLPTGVPNGEYRYNLRMGGKSVSTGLAIIGAPAEGRQYNAQTRITQYEG